MTSTLHERLHRLADQVDTTTDPTVGQELWRRGRRYQRVRRSGTVLAAGLAATAVLVVGSVAWQRSAPPPEPVPADAPVGLPSRIHDPSPWLPGTDEAGPLGQLVVLVHADRGGWFGSGRGVVGVSATGGEYRFLDLPDASDLNEVALAPDGRNLAYWTTGPTTDTPNTNGDYQRVATGVGVYDALTGEVVRHPIETAHGVTPSFLAWVDPDTLVLDYAQDVGGDDDSSMDQSSGADAPMLWWDLGREPQRFAAGDDADLYTWGPSVNGRVVARGADNAFHLISGGGDIRRLRTTGSVHPVGAVDASATRFAAVWAGDGRNPNRVALATLGRSGAALRYELLANSGQTFEVEGWIDRNHVAVTRRSEPLRDGLGVSLFAVDVRSGASSELVALPEGSFNVQVWATDLLDAPVVDRPVPPEPMDPRWTTAWLVAIGVGAAAGIWGWRRRVRP